jgi:23S rRNA (uracil1939-C5)-methyltransferase
VTVSLRIVKNVYGGDGLARLGDGRVAFVAGAWAGELVKAEIFEEKRNFVRARLTEIVEASPERISGAEELSVPGCVYADLSLAGETAAKASQIAEFLSRARLWDGAVETVETPGNGKNYRNKVVYHFERKDGGWAIGYRCERSHRVVDIERDPLAVPEINAKLPEIRRSVKALLTSGPMAVRRQTERKETLTVRWTPKCGVNWWLGAAPEGMMLRETTCGLDFEVPAGGFYQVNGAVGNELVKTVARQFAGTGAEELFDLYCGVGVFGVCCRPKKLTGVEYARAAVKSAENNAAKAGVPARFLSGEVVRNISRLGIGKGAAVVVDPPRGGMERGAAAALADSMAGHVFYVSCDPATLTRDLNALARTYAVESVKWFNMFPRTARFETLVSLRRK